MVQTSKTSFKYAAFLFLSFLAFSAMSYVVDRMVDFFDTPPIKINSGAIDSSVLKPGEGLRISLTVTRDRVCHTVTSRYVHSSSGEVVAYQEMLGGDAPIGTSRYGFTFPLPLDIKPGRYSFKGVVSSTCGSRRYIETTPIIPFSVIS